VGVVGAKGVEAYEVDEAVGVGGIVAGGRGVCD
jgi:hypothetical protein